jgi:hypothetical protein
MNRHNHWITIQIDPFPTGEPPGARQVPVEWRSRQPETVKVTWRFPDGWRDPDSQPLCWPLKYPPLLDAVEEVRKALDELSDLYVDGWECETRPKREVIREQLFTVAEWGRLLHLNFFSEAPRRLRDYLRDPSTLRDAYDIRVEVSPNVGDFSLPWGLFFDPRVKLTSGTSGRDLRDGLWSMGRRVATLFENPGELGALGEYPGELVSVISPTALEESGGRIDGWPRYCKWNEFLRSQDEDMRERVLYIYCHGASNGLDFERGTSEEPITAGQFSLYVGSRPDDALEIPVVNACGSYFAASGDWLRYVWKKGLRGFIGAEAKVPTAFAWEFGRDLVRGLLSKRVRARTVSEVLHRLRLKHWPLGLLYGLYALPDVSFHRRVGTDYIPVVRKNWCDTLGGRVSPAADRGRGARHAADAQRMAEATLQGPHPLRERRRATSGGA